MKNYHHTFKWRAALAFLLVAMLLLDNLANLKLYAADNAADITKVKVWVVANNNSTVVLNTDTTAADPDQPTALTSPIKQSSELKLRVEFTAPNNLDNMQPLEIALPKEYNINQHGDENYPDKNNDFFTYRYDKSDPQNKKIIVTFKKDVMAAKNGAGAKCYLETAASFSLNQADTDNEKTITVNIPPVAVNKTFAVRFLAENVTKNLSKSGKFYSTQDPTRFENVTNNQYINPHEIKWTIDVNKQLTNIPEENAVIIDEFNPAQIKYQAGSLKIFPLRISLGGEATQENTALTADRDYTLTSTNGNLTITFLNSGSAITNGFLTKAYRIEYITDILNTFHGEKLTVQNDVKLKDTTITDTASLSIASKLSDSLSKSAVHMVAYSGNEVNDSVYYRWNVFMNRSQRRFLEFTDTLPDGLELINYGKSPFPKQGNPDEATIPDINNGDAIYNAFFIQKYNPQYLLDKSLDEYVNLSTDDIKELFVISYNDASRQIRIVPKDNNTKIFDAFSIIYNTKYLPPKQDNYENNVRVKVQSGTEEKFLEKRAQTGVLKSELSKNIDKHTHRDQGSYHVDYVNGLLRWTIVVDPKLGSMKNLVITDYFANNGMDLVSPFGTYYYHNSNSNSLESMKIDYSPFAIYTQGQMIPREKYDVFFSENDPGFKANTSVKPNGGKLGFQIAFKDDYSLVHPLTILYHTKINRLSHRLASTTDKVDVGSTGLDERDFYRNHVYIDWPTGTKKLNSTDKYFIVHPFVKDNGGKRYGTFSVLEDGKNVTKTIHPTTREMEWVIYTNYNAEQDTISRIEDTISDGHKLVPNSFKVYEYTLNSRTGEPDSIETLKTKVPIEGVLPDNFTKQDSHFELEINNGNKRYALFYKTVLTDEKSRAEYANTATLNDRVLKATVPFNVKPEDYFVTKSGIQRLYKGGKTEYVDWKLNINKGLSHLTDVVITDTLGQDQEYDLESFKLVHYPNETDVVSTDDYTLEFPPFDATSPERRFTLKFKKPINTEYRLLYSSFVTRDANSSNPTDFKPTNQISIQGGNVESTHGRKSIAVEFSTAYTTAGSKIKLRKLNIKKWVQNVNSKEVLSGAYFQLYKENKLYRSFPGTNDQGLTSTKVPAGDYLLREVILDKNNYQYITLNDIPVTIPVTKDSVDVEVINYPKIDLKIEKVLKTDTTKKIKGIVFELYTKNPYNKIYTFSRTNDIGMTDLKLGLDVGTYILKEQPNSNYKPIGDMEIVITEEMVKQIIESGNPVKVITVENEASDPILPYIPSPNTPAEDPKKEEPKTETPDKPNPETPDTPNVPNTDVPKENNPDSETPKTPNPETPSQPSPEPETPTIDGEIDIPENVIPLKGKDPKNGIVVLDGNKWKYTPNKGFYGKDSFTVILRTPDGEETEEIIEVDVPVPLGHTTLPQTDGIPPFVFFFAGSLAFFGAYFFKKRA